MATKATLKSNSAMTQKEADAALLAIAQEAGDAERKVKTAEAKFLIDLATFTQRGAFDGLADEKAIGDHAVDLWCKGSGSELSADTRKTKRSQYLAAVKLGQSERAAMGIANLEAVTKVWEANAPKGADDDTRARLFPTLLKVARQVNDGEIKGEISAAKAKAFAVPTAPKLSAEEEAKAMRRRIASLQNQLKEALEKAGLDTKSVHEAMIDLSAAIAKATPKVVKLAVKNGKRAA